MNQIIQTETYFHRVGRMNILQFVRRTMGSPVMLNFRVTILQYSILLFHPATTGYIELDIHDRFIIKVSSLHGGSHINLGFLLSSLSCTIVFRHSRTTHTRPVRARLSFQENVISKPL